MRPKSEQSRSKDSVLVSLVRLCKIGCFVLTVLGSILWADYVNDPKTGQLWKGGPNSPLTATILWIYPAIATGITWLAESNLRSRGW